MTPLRSPWRRLHNRPSRACMARLLPAAAALLALAQLLLPHAAPPHCESPGDSGCAPEADNPTLDVVAVALMPSCVAAAAITALNRFVNPRRIVVITRGAASGCSAFRRMGPNVECLDDAQARPRQGRSPGKQLFPLG